MGSNKKVWPNDYIRFFHLVDTHPLEEPLFDRNLSLDQSHMTEPYVAAWAAMAVSDTMTFGYDNFKDRMKKVHYKYYTDDGQESLLSTFERTKLVELAKQNKHILITKPKSLYVLHSEGVVDGIYQWVFEIPIFMTVRDPKNTSIQSFSMKVKVIRTNDPYGMAIDEYVQ